ncbi:MAG: carboxymuconolactone decarboxylase family protein [Candidatus Thorarchaeota archaeon]
MEKEERYNRGSDLIRKMFGEEHQERRAEMVELYPDWDKYTKEFLYGEIYHRPGLSLKMRSLCNLAALTVLGREVEVETHIIGALNNGATKEEIIEVLIQMGFYGGWPVTVAGLRVATRAFKRIGLLNEK